MNLKRKEMVIGILNSHTLQLEIKGKVAINTAAPESFISDVERLCSTPSFYFVPRRSTGRVGPIQCDLLESQSVRPTSDAAPSPRILGLVFDFRY